MDWNFSENSMYVFDYDENYEFVSKNFPKRDINTLTQIEHKYTNGTIFGLIYTIKVGERTLSIELLSLLDNDENVAMTLKHITRTIQILTSEAVSAELSSMSIYAHYNIMHIHQLLHTCKYCGKNTNLAKTMQNILATELDAYEITQTSDESAHNVTVKTFVFTHTVDPRARKITKIDSKIVLVPPSAACASSSESPAKINARVYMMHTPPQFQIQNNTATHIEKYYKDLDTAQADLASEISMSQNYATELMLHMEHIMQFASHSQESITDAELLSQLAILHTRASEMLTRLKDKYPPTDVALTFEEGSLLPQFNQSTAQNTVAERLHPIQASPSPTNELVYIQSPRAISILHTLDIVSKLNIQVYANQDTYISFPYIHAHTYNKILAHLKNISHENMSTYMREQTISRLMLETQLHEFVPAKWFGCRKGYSREGLARTSVSFFPIHTSSSSSRDKKHLYEPSSRHRMATTTCHWLRARLARHVSVA
jgi:hypothetical protein